MIYSIQVITSNSNDLKTGILVVIDENQYIFNVPDGFQRAAIFNKLNFGKSKYVFVSSLSPDHFGGFPGFFLTAGVSVDWGRDSADAGLPLRFCMNLVGPKGLKTRLSQAHSFVGSIGQMRIVESTSDVAKSER